MPAVNRGDERFIDSNSAQYDFMLAQRGALGFVTANPVGAYPTSLTGARTVEDGDVIEATAVVLVPWQDDGAADALDARRGRAARTLFTQDVGSAVTSANLLPLAMLALQGNSLVWLDEAMVRRELGADRGDLAPQDLMPADQARHDDGMSISSELRPAPGRPQGITPAHAGGVILQRASVCTW